MLSEFDVMSDLVEEEKKLRRRQSKNRDNEQRRGNNRKKENIKWMTVDGLSEWRVWDEHEKKNGVKYVGCAGDVEQITRNRVKVN